MQQIRQSLNLGLKNFVVFLGEAQPKKSRLFERGTSEFRDFGGVSLEKQEIIHQNGKTRPFTHPITVITLNSFVYSTAQTPPLLGSPAQCPEGSTACTPPK